LVGCGGFGPEFLPLNPAVGAGIQEVERQDSAAQHLVVEAADVEFRTQLLLRSVAKFAELELAQFYCSYLER
jgi:hypothetical protein